MGKLRNARPPLPRWTVPLVAAGILVLMSAVLVALWWWVNRQPWTDPEKRTAALLDVVKVASGVALGGGGLFTLYLAARRQRTQELELAQREQAQADTNADAEARRVTELYAKAVQQLGESKAPVRLGGLYALERLGQEQPDTRQTIVNVLCAYLRMPYTPPPEITRPLGGVSRPLLRSHRKVGIRPPEGANVLVEAQLEQDVRLTAQRILAAHLRPMAEADYWGVREIDLTGAVLLDFGLDGARLGTAMFGGARFVGDARFKAEFTGPTTFQFASFTGEAMFGRATFTGQVTFDGASFGDHADFSSASFDGVTFNRATFADHADFENASFTRYVSFDEATFAEDAQFSEVVFSGHSSFRLTSFAGTAWFDEAYFDETTSFNGTRFLGKKLTVSFADTMFKVSGQSLAPSWPDGWSPSSTTFTRPRRDGEWAHLTQDE